MGCYYISLLFFVSNANDAMHTISATLQQRSSFAHMYSIGGPMGERSFALRIVVLLLVKLARPDRLALLITDVLLEML
jgi:hypothetical protein